MIRYYSSLYNYLVAVVEGLDMWSAAPSNFAHSYLGPLSSVDIVCAMGMLHDNTASISTTIKNSHTRCIARGLFCAQLLARMLDTLAESPVSRHLAAHFIDAMNHR
jgi:hypothetical protein